VNAFVIGFCIGQGIFNGIALGVLYAIHSDVKSLRRFVSQESVLRRRE